ncbi:MAG: beta-propeller domain-containing protein [Bdellovibrio sp.]|nr:beta-propeller domain-containing protein [Bdellovibrio sp.]
MIKINKVYFFVIFTVIFLSFLSQAGDILPTLNAVPKNLNSIESQLMRFPGQTMFLNYDAPRFRYARDLERNVATGGKQRAQQESDIFKVGKSGTKLLFLLNNYRGLQVVSFAAGSESPKLLGRVAATGNWPSDMYYDEANDRLIVLERLWYDDSKVNNNALDVVQSRLLFYDVKDPSNPSISFELPLVGEFADSRMVGDVLYVVTSSRPYGFNSQNGENKPKGYVHSVKLLPKKAETIQTLELSLPSSSRENMNIVEVEEGGAYKYYLLSVLSESGWGWWDRNSLVEVVDISSEEGKIKSLMTVSAKGVINERSWTHIKNGTLIVTSNYSTADVSNSNGNSVQRIAVETFTLPKENQSTLSEKQAEFRRLWIDNELDKLHVSADERERQYQVLLSNSDFGLKGQFVATDGKLRKVVADSIVTAGDTQGQNASIQDVRYVGDLLYVFWAPQNQKDPFDLFNIKNPQQGVSFIKRLYFDGWIEKAFPIVFENRNFVLGLGWIVENINNERGTRYPQAMLFEVSGEGEQARAVDLAQLSLKGSKHSWTNFDLQDKFFDIKSTSDGLGAVMFTLSSWNDSGDDNEGYASGGKLIGFNLKNAALGRAKEVFKTGAMLSAPGDWLRRVFTNPEIDRVNTFSDSALGVFDIQAIGLENAIVKAANVLELARNIVNYVTFKTPSGVERGIQVISSESWTNSANQNTVLRLVNITKADSEKHEILGELILGGSFRDMFLDLNSNSLFMATNASERKGNDYSVKSMLHKVSYAGSSGAEVLAIDQTLTLPKSEKNKISVNTSRHLFLDGEKLLLADDSGQIFIVDVKLFKDIQKVDFSGCDMSTIDSGTNDKMKYGELLLLSEDKNTFWLATSESVNDPKNKNIKYSRNFVSPVTFQGTKAACGARINIPGQLIVTPKSGHLVTKEERLMDPGSLFVKKSKQPSQQKRQNTIESLEVTDDGKFASLKDDYVPRAFDFYQDIKTVGKGRLGYLFWEETSSGYMPFMSRFWPRARVSGGHFVVLGFGEDLRFNETVIDVSPDVLLNATLVSVVSDPKANGSYLGILNNGKRFQVIKWTEDNFRPSVLAVKSADPNTNALSNAKQWITAPSWWWGGWNTNSGLHFTEGKRSFEVSLGMSGVLQFYLAE